MMKTVLWVVTEVNGSRVSVELASLGFQVTWATPKDALGIRADLRILSCNAFETSQHWPLIDYRDDPRPTLLLVGTAAQEAEALGFIRRNDEIGRLDDSPAILAKRLARLSLRHELDQGSGDRRIRDELTGFPNRCNADILLRITHAARSKDCIAVLSVDINGFKSINDRHGHAAGDQILVELASRLLQQQLDRQPVARVGGDEFVLLLIGKDRPSVRDAAGKVVAALVDVPYEVGGTSIALDLRTTLTFITGYSDDPDRDDLDPVQFAAPHRPRFPKGPDAGQVAVPDAK